jgi:hypothetical protein
MAYDDANGYIVLYGGAVNGTSTANGSCTPSECPHLNDTWTFVGGAWKNITATASGNGTPPGRWEASTTNDSSDGYVVIFGGQANGAKSRNATGNFTWKFLDGTWTNISDAAFSPGTRLGAAMSYDKSTENVVLFSGLSGTGSSPLQDDTWFLHQGSWECFWFGVGFTETGLPANTTWSVTLTAVSGSPTTLISNTTTLTSILSNGTYAYAIAALNGFAILKGSSSGRVTADLARFSVTWTVAYYTVAFTEKGLPTLTNWSVELTSTSGTPTSNTSDTTTIKFIEPNGNYSYLASSPGHPNSTGSVLVNGSAPSPVKVNFGTSSPSSSSLPTIDYVIFGAVAVWLAIGLVVVLRRRRRRSSSATPASPPGSSPPGPGLPPPPP